MSLGTIYGPKQAPRVLRVLAAAAYNGSSVDVQEYTVANGDNQKSEYLEKFPLGKLPAFQGTDGTLLFESSAIARFVAGVSTNANLLGTDNKSAAQVEQWISVAENEILANVMNLYRLYNGLWPYNKVVEEKAWTGIHRALAVVESHLKKQTFLVGHRVTLADLTLAANLHFTFTHFAGEEVRSKYPNVTRYYNTVSNQAPVLSLFKGAEFTKENAKFTPPKKEEKAKKPAAAAAAQRKAASKPKAKKADSDDDDDEPSAPAPKPAAHPCASLPPSPFVLDEAKRQYSNLDTPDFLKWFYENFDKEGYSIWKFDFKYNEELTQVFMSANQIGGFFSRLEASRKYLLGNGGVYGENNASLIAGVLILRGKDWKPVIDVAPDFESYEYSPLDPFNNAEDKEFFEGNLTWEGSYKGKKCADAKTFK